MMENISGFDRSLTAESSAGYGYGAEAHEI
jgi:hypothetical protein